MHCAVCKGRGGVAKPQHSQHRFMRDPSERHDRAQSWHGLDGRREKLPAGVDLGGQGLVLGRHAAHRVADPAIDQGQPVVGPRLINALGKTEFKQGGVEQVAGEIAGKGPAGAVGALLARRKPDDQQSPVGIAKRRHGGIEPAGFARARGIAETCEPRTEWAVAVGLGAAEGAARRQPLAARRIIVQSSKSSSSPLGAVVVARCRNCGA